MSNRITVDVYQRGQSVEIGDRHGNHLTTMTREEAIELYEALGDALGMSRTNVATGNAVVGQQIGNVNHVIPGGWHGPFGDNSWTGGF